MPNGGSDCCSSSWFNSKNDRNVQQNKSEPHYCQIRDLLILRPSYTYCANHPYRNPQRIATPIGPVWQGNSEGFRQVWKLAPDTEEIRQNLLNLLAQIQEQPSPEYPIGVYADEIIIWQIGELRETRAINELNRIGSFKPETEADDDLFHRNRQSTISVALIAIEKIEGKIPLDFTEEPN